MHIQGRYHSGQAIHFSRYMKVFYANPSYNETLRACFTVVKSKFFLLFFLRVFLRVFLNATRKKLVTLDFCIFLKLSKRKRAYGIESIHSMITETLFHFLIQQTGS